MTVSADRIFTAALIVIGDEILSGRTQDANLAYLAKWLNVQGIRLAEVRVVADDMDAIAGAVNALRPPHHDYLFTTGGIGPTHDDISVDAIAAALGLSVVMHPKAEATLRGYYGDKITDRNGLMIENFGLPCNLMLSIPTNIVEGGLEGCLQSIRSKPTVAAFT